MNVFHVYNQGPCNNTVCAMLITLLMFWHTSVALHRAVLGEPGSAAFLFDHKGVVTVSRKEVTSDPLDLAIEVGAEDVSCEEQDEEGNEMCRFLCDPNSLKSVSDALKEKKLKVSSTALEYIPKSYAILDEEKYNKACALLDALSEHADIIHVYNNISCNSWGM